MCSYNSPDKTEQDKQEQGQGERARRGAKQAVLSDYIENLQASEMG